VLERVFSLFCLATAGKDRLQAFLGTFRVEVEQVLGHGAVHAPRLNVPDVPDG
jgi:hypothetical protein